MCLWAAEGVPYPYGCLTFSHSMHLVHYADTCKPSTAQSHLLRFRLHSSAMPAARTPAAWLNVQVQVGFAGTRAVRRNNVNLLRLFLSRWLYATPLDLEALLKHVGAPVEDKAEEVTAKDKRQFGMQLLVLGA